MWPPLAHGLSVKHLATSQSGPKTAHHELHTFIAMWVEGPSLTAGIFLIPHMMQQDWGYLSKHILEAAVIYPSTLSPCLRLSSLIPPIVLYVPHYV
jgi:hypothetical protein